MIHVDKNLTGGSRRPGKRSETRSELHDLQSRRSFEAVGRFIQSFELILDAARFGCTQLVATNPAQQRLLGIAFAHPVLAACPLTEILHAMLSEIVHQRTDGAKDERDVTIALLEQVTQDCKRIVASANRLLRGAWDVGHSHARAADGDSALAFSADIFRATLQIDKISALEVLTADCTRLEQDIRRVVGAVIDHRGPRAAKNFRLINGRWETYR
jgi:hypothetical protein